MFHFPLLSPAHWRFSGDFEPLAVAYIYRVFHVMMRASSFHRFKTIRHQWSSKNGNHQVNGQPIFPIPRAYRSEIIHCLHVCTCVRRHFLASESIWNTRRRRKEKKISRLADRCSKLLLFMNWSYIHIGLHRKRSINTRFDGASHESKNTKMNRLILSATVSIVFRRQLKSEKKICWIAFVNRHFLSLPKSMRIMARRNDLRISVQSPSYITNNR